MSPAPPSLVRGLASCGLLLLAGCAVGPDYQRPAVPTPAAYSEKGPWKVAEPKDGLPKAEWWKVFHDPVLDSLEAKALSGSPTLGAALARYDQALDAARQARSALYPNLSLQASGGRERYSGNRQAEYPQTTFGYTSNSFDLPLVLNYQIDLFGEVRRSLESARDLAQAQGAAYQNVLLMLQAGVAQNYFTLRSLISQREYLVENVTLLQDALDLVRKLRQGGANSDLDVYQAEAELATVQSEAIAADRQIAEQRHGLAVLVGENPESFRVDAAPLDGSFFPVPVGLPSELLERRPDISQAERTMAAANARVGVAKAAFFPAVGLTALAGTQSSNLDNLLNWSSRQWAAGPTVTLPIFNGGYNAATYRQAQDAYRESVDNYRQQVLEAFREVEDGLSDLKLLEQQTEALEHAVAASDGASRLSLVRYKAGLVSYIEVIDSQRTQLESELTLTQTRAARLTATVLLVQALGGGW